MTAQDDDCVNSDDSVTWHAHREAEKVSDSSLVDELAEYVNREGNKERRRAAYFILGKLGQKARGVDCASILLSRLSDENGKYVLSDLLDALSSIDKPGTLDLAPVYRLLRDERWLVRHSAIQALKRTDTPEAEDELIRLLTTTTDPDDMTYCHATLNGIGSAKSLPYLEKNLGSRKRDVKLSAMSAIQAIKSRS